MDMKIKPRHKILAFYGVPIKTAPNAGVTFLRMRKFTSLTQNKNPIEYARQYVDEPFQRTDVTGYAPTIDYGFDRHSGNMVLEDIVDITDRELVGDDAVRSIIIVDTETGKAVKRDYSVIPGTEGDNTNIYNYSGTFKARSDKVFGTATGSPDWENITFEEESVGNT